MTLARVFFRDLAPLLCVSLVALTACGGGTGTTSTNGGNNGNGGATSPWSGLSSASDMQVAGTAGQEGVAMSDGKLAILSANSDGITLQFFDAATLVWSVSAAMQDPLYSYNYAGGCVNGASGTAVVAGFGSGPDPMLIGVYNYDVGSWSAGGPNSVIHMQYAFTCLAGGKVLMAGGQLYQATPSAAGVMLTSASAEIYDPATGVWSAAAPMNYPREYFTLIALPDGRAMAIGGVVNPWTAAGADTEGSAEIYDPATNTWTLTGPLNTPRELADTLVLSSGKVLVAGGNNSGTGPLASAELYDPATNQWTAAGHMQEPREATGMAELADGTVLVAGGATPYVLFVEGSDNGTPVVIVNPNVAGSLSSADMFDPATLIWSDAGSMSKSRTAPALIALPDGGAVACGGSEVTGLGARYADCERYTP